MYMFFYIYIQSLYRAYFLEEINNSSSRLCYIETLLTIFTTVLFVETHSFYLQKQLGKIRVSSHQLSIESGRHKNILRSNRIFKFCRFEIEDAYHFVLITISIYESDIYKKKMLLEKTINV